MGLESRQPAPGRLLLAVLLAAGVVLLAGCGDDEGPDEAPPADPPAETEPEPESSDPPPEADPPQTTTCTHEADGFSFEYPAEWHTNPGDVIPECSYVNPEPFEVPEATEFFDAAVEIRRERVPFERITGGDPATMVIERSETEVAGRPAVRRETETTPDGLLPGGTRGYQYLVDLGGDETLIVTTYDLPGHDFATNRDVVDEIAATLELTQR